jgi:alkanesulfonate monooxygenase SsuD/methylene tetrahydromethanopterin reductase-like flavin-dependent oxidoreductase (luciferase family)
MIGAMHVQLRPDPFAYLLLAATATRDLEVGTAIYNCALRNPVDVAQRILTIEALIPGRFTFGVGAGSTESADQAVGLDFDQRFRRFYENIDVIRRLCRGEHVTDVAHGATGEAFFNPPEGTKGPRMYLSAWHSTISLRHVVDEFDGWLCSAGYLREVTGTPRDRGVGGLTLANIAEAMKRYRDLGGTARSVISLGAWDFEARATDLGDDERFNLDGPPEVVGERLARIAEIGYTDVIFNNKRATNDDLHQLRAVVPRDPVSYAA